MTVGRLFHNKESALLIFKADSCSVSQDNTRLEERTPIEWA
jgi:hypothetical protein